MAAFLCATRVTVKSLKSAHLTFCGHRTPGAATLLHAFIGARASLPSGGTFSSSGGALSSFASYFVPTKCTWEFHFFYDVVNVTASGKHSASLPRPPLPDRPCLPLSLVDGTTINKAIPLTMLVSLPSYTYIFIHVRLQNNSCSAATTAPFALRFFAG